MKRGRKPGTPRTEIQILRHKRTIYLKSLDRFQQQHAEKMQAYEAKAKRQLDQKMQERRGEIELLEREIAELEGTDRKPEGPWLPADLPEAESFNRKWAEFLATMPEREAEIAKLAEENSRRLREELAAQDAERA